MEWYDPSTWGWYFLVGEWAVRLVMLVVVPFRRSPEAAKGWLLLVFFFPWFGLLLYGLIGRARLPAWRVEQMARLRDKLTSVADRLRSHPNIFHPELQSGLNLAVTLAESLGHLPILGGNTAEVLVDYEGTIARLAADIDAARNHVNLLYYIFADDAATQPVIEALARAAQRGVKCRVLIDHLGSRAYLKKLTPRLVAAGVDVREVLPVGLLLRKAGRYDLRNHRKIAVIDGRIGYTGSQNLISAVFKEGITYEELVVRVTGPAVLELQYIFTSDWYLETEEVLDSEAIFPDPELTGSVPAQALPSGPGYPTPNNQRLIVALIHGARKRVVITTPYFVPDEPLLQALQTAVLRGVEVHLVVSEKEDQLLVSLAQKSYYEELLESGVRIHLYKKNFLHAKHLSVDDDVALVGSSNMDNRSFLLNAEISLLFYDTGVAGALRAQQERYFVRSRLLSAEGWEARPLRSKVAENLARLLSPLL